MFKPDEEELLKRGIITSETNLVSSKEEGEEDDTKLCQPIANEAMQTQESRVD